MLRMSKSKHCAQPPSECFLTLPQTSISLSFTLVEVTQRLHMARDGVVQLAAHEKQHLIIQTEAK